MRCIPVFGVRVNGKLKMRCAPRCSTLRVSTWRVSRFSGGSGGPILPQAARKTERRSDKAMGRQGDGATGRQGGSGEPISPRRLVASSPCRPVAILQNVSTKVFILHNVGQHLAHVSCVNNLALLFQVGAFKGNLVEDFLQDRVQSARAYVLGGLVHLEGEVGYFVNRVFGYFGRDD